MMPEPYRIIGAELSPYSVKVRSYFRFKNIPHQWIVNMPGQGPYGSRFRIAVIPLVLTPDDEALQDSTPILERLEAERPDPSMHPAEPITRFVSDLLEEFGDEWGNKWMFHYRWAREVDQRATAWRAARLLDPDADEAKQADIAEKWRARMVDRVWFVGSNAETAPQIESGFRHALSQLEAHLADRAYLLGARPSFGDFGLWPQIYNAWTDPTPSSYISNKHPNVLAWLQRMLWPRVEGEFEPWADLEPTLAPLLSDHVGARFLPWSVANMDAIAVGRDEFSVELAGRVWTQKPQKYHAKSLTALRKKYAAIADKSALDRLLERTGCLAALRS
ncbi:MAG: glutathione S-transferase family protein [Caulobacterales bacterium]|nr:glutathione S-transferase family protein [Caulobacterales bacterium]